MHSLAEDEEELLLKQAIALSLEGAEDNDQDNSEQDTVAQRRMACVLTICVHAV